MYKSALSLLPIAIINPPDLAPLWESTAPVSLNRCNVLVWIGERKRTTQTRRSHHFLGSPPFRLHPLKLREGRHTELEYAWDSHEAQDGAHGHAEVCLALQGLGIAEKSQ